MEDYQEKSGEIRKLASLDPDQFSDHLSKTHNTLDQIAPNVAPHVYATAANAVQFLNNKLPSAGNELLQDKQIEPSSSQQKAWLDAYQTVNDPTSVLGHLQNNTLTHHHLEALGTIYPDLHQEMKEKIQEQLGRMKTEGSRLPYQKRLMMSRFLGQPLDSTMTPQSMQAIIQSASQNNGPAAQAHQKSQGKATGPELTQINKVNQIYATRSQQQMLANPEK